MDGMLLKNGCTSYNQLLLSLKHNPTKSDRKERPTKANA